MRGTIGRLVILLCVSACAASPPIHDAGNEPLRDGGLRDARALDAGAVRFDASTAIDSGQASFGPPIPLDDVIAALSDPGATADDLDEVLHDGSFAGGWPRYDETRFVFATRWDAPGGPVSLVSDVNGWNTTAHPATRAADPRYHFVIVPRASFVAQPEGAHYKWYAADVYRAPDEATAYGTDGFGEYGYVAPPTDVAWRERFVDFRSAFLDAPRSFRALLPAGFVPRSTSARSARQLFMHDGQNLFDVGAPFGSWDVNVALEDPAYDDIVVLAVDNAPDRFEAYTHTTDDIGSGPLGGEADAYLRLVHEEALPFFRARYGLAEDASRLVMAGSSLGGLITLYQAQRAPDDVACVIAMSSTLGWGAFARTDDADALVLRWIAHGSSAIYLDSGGSGSCFDTDDDGVVEDSDDRDNYCTTLQLRDRLISLGYESDVDLFHWHELDAEHTEAAWAARFPRGLAACTRAGWTR